MVRQFAYVHGVAGISLLSRKKYKMQQYSFFLSQKLHQETLIIKTMVSISCAQGLQWATKRAKNYGLYAQAFAPWTKPQKISH